MIVVFAAFGGQRAPTADERRDVGPSVDADDEENGAGDDVESSADDLTEQAPEDLEDPEDDGYGLLSHGDAGARKPRGPRGGCPGSMIRVHEYCIDRYEAPNRRGAKPLVMQSANDAAAWCTEHNKRVCTEDEWIGACEGGGHRPYPYGQTHVDGLCTDDKPWRPVDENALAKWPAPEAHAQAKALYQATPSGWKHKCASEDGVRDLTGNVEEWVVRTREHANAFPYLLVGCYWAGCYGGGKPTCHSTNDAHGPEFRFYETGFRCCRDAARAR
jgi:formylglycine-generating enzyme required for sulfatase activity